MIIVQGLPTADQLVDVVREIGAKAAAAEAAHRPNDLHTLTVVVKVRADTIEDAMTYVSDVLEVGDSDGKPGYRIDSVVAVHPEDVTAGDAATRIETGEV